MSLIRLSGTKFLNLVSELPFQIKYGHSSSPPWIILCPFSHTERYRAYLLNVILTLNSIFKKVRYTADFRNNLSNPTHELFKPFLTTELGEPCLSHWDAAVDNLFIWT